MSCACAPLARTISPYAFETPLGVSPSSLRVVVFAVSSRIRPSHFKHIPHFMRLQCEGRMLSGLHCALFLLLRAVMQAVPFLNGGVCSLDLTTYSSDLTIIWVRGDIRTKKSTRQIQGRILSLCCPVALFLCPSLPCAQPERGECLMARSRFGSSSWPLRACDGMLGSDPFLFARM